ncbi:MAG TPA: hypothetical protein VF773_17870 [Verrucomicrobiae bacterium]
MQRITRLLPRIAFLIICLVAFNRSANAQITNVLFSEDFESPINPLEFVPDAPFFEGGQGDIAGTVNGGVLEFTGTVSQQWWAGATMRVVPTFQVSDAQQIAVEVDRVQEAGVGTASRSALWIMDSTQTRYVLFADVRGEGGWSFNRKIGVAGDNPTGGGTQMTAFDGLDDGALYVMKAVADGRNVRLYLNDVLGATVPFPFTNLVFHLGSYARATGDTAFSQFDNFEVYSIGKATFEPTSVVLSSGQTAGNIVVRIPAGLNATAPVTVRVVSSNPAAAVPLGATGGTLNLTFAAGGPNTQTISVQSVGIGGASFSIENDAGLGSGNTLNVTVVSAAGVQLQDDFAGASLDPAKWERYDRGFEVGTGVYDVTQAGGNVTISGYADGQYWGGASIRSVPTFTATKDLPLVVEVDRVYLNRNRSDETPNTANRSSLWLTTTNHGQYIMFAQNLGENGWQVNINNTGGGTDIGAFNDLDTSTNLHRMKLIADGEGVDVYLDNEFGGRFPFAVTFGLHVELGGYTRDISDEVVAVFDNLKVENTLPCISVDNADISLNNGQTATVAVTIPRLLNLSQNASVTITSSSPSVAIPQGANNGTLTLNFAAGATNRQTFTVQTVGLGATTFNIASAGVCVQESVDVTVTAVPTVLLTDAFGGTTLGTVWEIDPNSLVEGGAATVDSGVFVNGGAVVISVTNEIGTLAGFSVLTTNTFSADVTHPATFEIDREKLDFTLVTGTAAKQLTGIWITNTATGDAIFFSELVTHDGSAGGWQYVTVNATNPFPANALGTSISAFGAAQYNDRGAHRLRAVANGDTVKLYLDGVFGAEVPFDGNTGIRFGFGTYVVAATDIARGTFDDAQVLGTESSGPGRANLSIANQPNGNITISWDAPGTLQFSDNLANPGSWNPVTPAPTGTTYTIPRAAQTNYRFFRVAH